MMQNYAKKRLSFEFNNKVDALMPCMELMSEHIVDCLPANLEDVLFRSKAVIIELLTNAIKHAGVNKTMFDIESDDHHIIIRKMDRGAPLNIMKSHNGAQNDNYPQTALISADPLNSLYATRINDDTICFTCEENLNDEAFPIEDMMEHFGMLIISRSATRFTYTYNKETGCNIFKAELIF